MRRIYLNVAAFLIAVIIGAALVILIPQLYKSSLNSTAIYATVLQALLIVIFGYIATHELESLVIAYGKGKQRMDERSLAKVARVLGYIVIIFILLVMFQVNLTGLLIGAGFLGIVVGLAAQATLGNLFSGISMMAAKPFAEGDRITFTTWQYGMMPPSYSHHAMLPGFSGVIDSIGLMYTKIKLDDGPVTFVPNAIINQAVVMNYSISNSKDVVVRVELVKKQFKSFSEEVVKRIHADKKLERLIGSKVDIRITDINLSNYGVAVRVTVPVSQEDFVSKRLPDLILGVAGKFQS